MIILMIVPMGVNSQDEKKDKKPILKLSMITSLNTLQSMEQVTIEHHMNHQTKNI